jgi:hypothetical protein
MNRLEIISHKLSEVSMYRLRIKLIDLKSLVMLKQFKQRGNL